MQVQVELGSRGYPIYIQHQNLSRLSDHLRDQIGLGRLSSHHAIVISDDHVARHYLEPVRDQLGECFSRVDTLVVPPGEKTKCVKRLEELWQRLVELESHRKSTVIALGGGVVGDLAGFVAASFGRGISFVQIPTSLLAQVDSSVGGKVGINLPSAKNIVGAFWQPRCVIIDPTVLNTLDEREYASGMAEVIKYGAIMDPEFFEFLESSIEAIKSREMATLEKVIAKCCELKAKVVIEDEEEQSGRRAILNYGHTYGHAIESVFGYGEYTHGEAIAIGMNCAARLAIGQGILKDDLLKRQTRLFEAVGLPVECPTENRAEIVSAMKYDKKVKDGVLMLVLPTRVGNVELVPSPGETLLLESLS